MEDRTSGWSHEQFDIVLGHVLRVGVVVSGLTVTCGAAVFLARHGGAVTDYHVFHGEPADLRTIGGILGDARVGSGRGVIQLGLLMLIATPIARVVFSAAGFVRQGNWKYVLITLIVLMLLLYGLATS